MVPPKIAVVHTDHAVTHLLVTLLEEEGYAPVPCTDPATALDQFHASRPDLAIIELDLGASYPGWSLASQFRADPLTRHIPLIALTTSSGLDATRPADCQHNCELVREPFDINSVLGLIRSLLKSPDHCRCC